MTYKDFIEAQKAWEAICKMVALVAYDKTKQLVMPTSTDDTDNYWLWTNDKQQDGKEHIIVIWCWHGGKPVHKDKVFADTMELKKWIFEQYTDGKIYDFYVDCV